MHTDYRNPSITHLSTRLLRKYATHNTGQTVLFDRYCTKDIIIEDSLRGRQVLGGLNGIKHANLGPKGDVQ